MRKASCSAITTRLVATVAGLAIFIATNATAAVLRVDRISMTVADLGRTEKFYRAGLGFQTVKRERIKDLGWATGRDQRWKRVAFAHAARCAGG